MTSIEQIQKMLTPNSAALVTDDLSRRYLTGFQSSAGTLVITKKDAVLLVDARYFETAEKEVSVCRTGLLTDLYEQTGRLLESEKTKKLLVETKSMTMFEFFRWQKNLSEVDLCGDDTLSSLIAGLRRQKSEDEKQKIKAAQRITDAAFRDILTFIRPGVTEKETAAHLHEFMLRHGAEPAFPIISLSGSGTSVPHGVPGDRKIEKKDIVLLDFGAKLGGWCSDMTRTVFVGEPEGEMTKIYESVRGALNAGMKVIKAGVPCREPDSAARSFIDKAGFGGCFTHGFGHGVGLEIHEEPRLSPASDEMLLEGDAVTAEPGIYVPGFCGVRIENFGFVTENGFEKITEAETGLLVVGG